MASKEFKDTTVKLIDENLNIENIGVFKKIIINDHEARLYNDSLESVFRFNSMCEEDYANLIFYISCEKRTDYYTHNGITAWDIIDIIMDYYGDSIDGSQAFYLGNIFKYLFRFKFKGQLQSDLEKAKDYIDRIVDNL